MSEILQKKTSKKEANMKMALDLLYLQKVQCSFIYSILSRLVKGYSLSLHEKFSCFENQDRNHAVALLGFVVDIFQKEPEEFMIGIQTYKITQILAATGKEKKDPDLFITLSKSLLDTMIVIERDIKSHLNGMVNKYQDLIEQSKEHLDLSLLLTVQESRLDALIDTRKRIESGLYFSRDKIIYWKCRYCGYIDTSEHANKECPCCKSMEAYQEPGNWREIF